MQQVLGKLLVATSLLTATLKFDSDITVQLQGDGPHMYNYFNFGAVLDN
ncbi:hsp33 family protein [Candidatus Erwinia dacicola]|uniref:Hsp33 family protein n=1 Tax=Candidatus Erwinia dacicola TaxID=252393 RepID=A0A328TUE8_9GAMM|nr:hsp33 family protein [Candidatus Erwinia dacicola]